MMQLLGATRVCVLPRGPSLDIDIQVLGSLNKNSVQLTPSVSQNVKYISLLLILTKLFFDVSCGCFAIFDVCSALTRVTTVFPKIYFFKLCFIASITKNLFPEVFDVILLWVFFWGKKEASLVFWCCVIIDSPSDTGRRWRLAVVGRQEDKGRDLHGEQRLEEDKGPITVPPA